MKIIHQNGFTKDELLSYRGIIYKNLVDSAQAIILQMRKIQVDCEIPANRVRFFSLLSYHLSLIFIFLKPLLLPAYAPEFYFLPV
jgi:hypothetical protein